MRFTEYGASSLPTLLFIHGSCTTAEICFSGVAKQLCGSYHCILCALDGHEKDKKNSFVSLDSECRKIERAMQKHYGGKIYGLVGLSLGATICVHLMSRGKLSADKVILDGVYLVDIGAVRTAACIITCVMGIKYIKAGGKVPDKLIGKIFGRGNTAVVNMMFEGMSAKSVKNVFNEVYRYRLADSIECGSDILCVRGEYEPIPKKSFAMLKKVLPHIREKVIPNCGHAQFLNEHENEYAAFLTAYLQ